MPVPKHVCAYGTRTVHVHVHLGSCVPCSQKAAKYFARTITSLAHGDSVIMLSNVSVLQKNMTYSICSHDGILNLRVPSFLTQDAVHMFAMWKSTNLHAF